MGQQRFRNLDAMRGVCALSVVLFHCDNLFAHGAVFCHGYLAVDLFFILSGFVIAHTYEDRLSTGFKWPRFALMRLKRLGPTYWAGSFLGVVTLVTVASYQPPGTFYAPSFLVISSLMTLALVPQLAVAGPAYPANPAAWSLFGEAIANLLYARWMHRWGMRTLVFTAFACWAVCAVYSFLTPHGWCFGAGVDQIAFVPFKAVAGFVMGVILFRAWRAGWFERLPAVSPLIILALWAIIAEVPTYGPTPTFDSFVVIVLGPLLVALLVRAPDSAPRPFLWLGAVSYPLYASHLSIVFLARMTPLLGFDRGPNPLAAVFVVVSTLMLAWTIHRFIEARRPVPAVAPSTVSA